MSGLIELNSPVEKEREELIKQRLNGDFVLRDHIKSHPVGAAAKDALRLPSSHPVSRMRAPA